jgi:hypothetical protein
VCFFSKGDNITPPPQALGWILDLYGSVEDIRAHGQMIGYCVHGKVGHLGIFVSGAGAKKEHQEFASGIDLIDCLPPGLYEAVLKPAPEPAGREALPIGDYVARFEARTLDDICALGCNDPADEREFAAVARLSEVNLGLYRNFVQPWVRPMATEQGAELLRRLNPARLQFELFSDKNPLLQPVAATAERVRADRRTVPADNPLLAAQEQTSRQIKAGLDACRDWRDRLLEATFHAVYSNPLLQALLGLKAFDDPPRLRPSREPEGLAFARLDGAAAGRHGQGRAARGRRPRAALRRAAHRGGRRARLRRDPQVPQRAGARLAAGRVQGAGPRPVPDAADRPGAGGRGPARVDPGRRARRRAPSPRSSRWCAPAATSARRPRRVCGRSGRSSALPTAWVIARQGNGAQASRLRRAPLPSDGQALNVQELKRMADEKERTGPRRTGVLKGPDHRIRQSDDDQHHQRRA